MHARDAMPPVPAGYVRLAEYGDHDRQLDATTTVIAQAVAAVHSYPLATLAHVTRGFVPAGSCMRWDEACWSVSYWLPDGTRHGRRFLETREAEARAYFAALTDPQAVSARRQDDAYWAELRAQRQAAAKPAARRGRRAAA